LKTDHRNFIYFLFIIAGLVTLPGLVQDGMFMDGVMYATVAKNFANGNGTWWDLHLFNDPLLHYRDQPPLTIWITSFFFRLFGNSMYVERFYCFLVMVVCLLLISKLWKTIYADERKQLWWIPALWFIITPIVNWSFRNNMEENTMTIFILLAAICFFKSFRENKNEIVFGFIHGICVFLSFMCKGLQGTFTIIIPFVYLFFYRRENNRILKFILCSTLSILLLSALIYLNEHSRNYFIDYAHARLYSTFIDADRPTTQNRGFLLYRIAGEIGIGLGIILIIILVYRWKRKFIEKIASSDKTDFFIFLSIAIAGSFPLLITLEQRSWYLIPSFPFYIIAFCCLFSNRLLVILGSLNISNKFIKPLNSSLLIALTGSCLFLFGKTSRHAELLRDVYIVGKIVPAYSTIEASEDQAKNYSLPIYLQRYFNIDVKLKQDTVYSGKFLLKSKTDQKNYSNRYHRYDSDLNGYELFR
jgi:4-amino-4-deoxy-L-arabinose transferase-like glycosyltransferase